MVPMDTVTTTPMSVPVITASQGQMATVSVRSLLSLHYSTTPSVKIHGHTIWYGYIVLC